MEREREREREKIIKQLDLLKKAVREDPSTIGEIGPQIKSMVSNLGDFRGESIFDTTSGLVNCAGHCKGHQKCVAHCISHPKDVRVPK